MIVPLQGPREPPWIGKLAYRDGLRAVAVIAKVTYSTNHGATRSPVRPRMQLRIKANPGETPRRRLWRLNGRLDVDNQHYFTGDVRVETTHIDIGAPQVPRNASPLRLTDGRLPPVSAVHRLRGDGDAAPPRSTTHYRWSAAASRRRAISTTSLVQGGLRVYYEFVPGYQGYVRCGYNRRDCDRGACNGVPTLSSSGYCIDVGGRINLTGVTYVDGFVGYLDENYQAASAASISAPPSRGT